MTKEQLAEIQSRADAATEGPWRVQEIEGSFQLVVLADVPTGRTYDDESSNIVCLGFDEDYEYACAFNAENDIMMICKARTDIPALLDYIRELEARLDKCEAK